MKVALPRAKAKAEVSQLDICIQCGELAPFAANGVITLNSAPNGFRSEWMRTVLK